MKLIDQGIIFDAQTAPPHQRANCFTSLALLPSGDVLASFHTGSTKDSPDENVMIRRSSDLGKSWETIFEGLEPAIDGVRGAWRYGGLSLLDDRRLLGAFCWFDRSDPARPLANPKTQGTLPSRVFVMESEDEGRTWTRRSEVDTRPFAGIASTGPVLNLANGDLGVHYESWKSYEDTSAGRHHAILRLSHDEGRTFDPAVIVANDPAANVFYWDQRLAVDPETGTLIGLYWTHDRSAQRDINIHIGWGSEDGKVWTKPMDTGIAGQIANPLPLPGGRVLAVYVHRHYPPGLRAVLSHDFGKTWDTAGELVFYEGQSGRESGMDGKRDFGDYWNDMNVWSFGHPEAALLPDGDVLAAFYGGTPGALSMRWARLQV